MMSRLPLSFSQSRIWLLNQISGPDAQYNVPIVVRSRNRIDADALHEALRDVMLRHEILRTVYREADGDAVQIVREPRSVREVMSVERLPESLLAVRIAEISTYAFALDAEVPLRAWLLTSDSADDVVVLVTHHIAVDGASLVPLLRDLGAAYAARRDLTAPRWDPLPVQYSDFGVWQRAFLGDCADPNSVSGRQLAYWREKLARLPVEIELPTDRPRPQSANFGGAEVSMPVPAGLHHQVIAVAQAERVSPFTVFHAAMAAFLSRSGAGADIPLGGFVSGRTDAALDDLVGFFVNTLVFRLDVSAESTFRELLRRARAVEIEAYSHQDLPFELIVKELRPIRSPSRHPLVQTAISYENADFTALKIPGLGAEVEIAEHGRAKFDLYIRFIAGRDVGGEPTTPQMKWRYATALFDARTIEAMAERFIEFLGCAAVHPEQIIEKLPAACSAWS
ncbi:hypothetical protein GCM10010517_75920 [Streptosporangium fragile]|uniref:Condensation domain-containing protein n=1 Tax=Streptosporangium fragile TaxID=46186 RepID=A0ABN3WB30_9ACTN